MAKSTHEAAPRRDRLSRYHSVLLLTFAGVLWAGGVAEDRFDDRAALACTAPASAGAHDRSDHVPADAPSLDGGSAWRAAGAALDRSLPKVKLGGAPHPIAPEPVIERRLASLEPARGFGAAQATYLLTRRLRI